ncbi:MAG TPA: hypothetical protein VF933_28445 [Streptosporangiaceae bacterium]
MTTLRERNDEVAGPGSAGPPPRPYSSSRVPLAGPPALARAATGLPAGARDHAQPQRTPPGAGAASRAGQASAGEDSPVIGGPGPADDLGREAAGRGIVVLLRRRAGRGTPPGP